MDTKEVLLTMKVREFDFVGWRNFQLSQAGLVAERPEMFLMLSIYEPINELVKPITGMMEKLGSILSGTELSCQRPVISIREDLTEVMVSDYEEWKDDFATWHTGNVFQWSTSCYWPLRNEGNHTHPVEVPDKSIAILEISGLNPDVMPDGSLDPDKGRSRFLPTASMVDVEFRIAYHCLPNDSVKLIADGLAEMLTFAHSFLGACWGCVTIDQFDSGTTPFERWYSTKGRWRRPKEHPRGYYWANLITTKHIERLGGHEGVARMSESLGFPTRLIQDELTFERSMVVRMNSPIDRYTAAELRAMKELLGPSLLYPDGGYEYYLGPRLEIIPDEGTACVSSIDGSVPELEDADFDVLEFFEVLTSEWGINSIGMKPGELPFLD